MSESLEPAAAAADPEPDAAAAVVVDAPVSVEVEIEAPADETHDETATLDRIEQKIDELRGMLPAVPVVAAELVEETVLDAVEDAVEAVEAVEAPPVVVEASAELVEPVDESGAAPAPEPREKPAGPKHAAPKSSSPGYGAPFLRRRVK